MRACLLLLAYLALRSFVCSSESPLCIHSVSDLLAFSNSINNGGTTYSGTTVYLDSDMDFTEELSREFKPIGDKVNYFLGTFDGQGHVIRNLALRGSVENVGLFGYSNGATIRIIVMDSSCSVVSSFTDSVESAFVGGVVGYCTAGDAPRIIESIVNMADVSFDGSVSASYAFLGGVLGMVKPLSLTATVANCVNYGAITSAGMREKAKRLEG